MRIRYAVGAGAAAFVLLTGCGETADEGADPATDPDAEKDPSTETEQDGKEPAPEQSEPGQTEQTEPGAEITETVDITAVDYAFEGAPETAAPGTEFTLMNDSPGEVHEIVLFRINDDETRPVEELLQLPEEEAGEVAMPVGFTVALPGEEAVTPEGPVVVSEPGRYAMVCFIPQGADPEVYREAIEGQATEPPPAEGGPPHFTEGMFAEFEVTE